jgi:dinuclear metal center YbgI/SA1388 family protein
MNSDPLVFGKFKNPEQLASSSGGFMTIGEVIEQLEQWAPLSYQEPYDNAGLLTGSRDSPARKALVTLDCTEPVVDEAIREGANLVIAHHPILFKGLKSITGKTYVERTLIKAIKNDIAIYAIHTNLDNVLTGVSQRMAQVLKLQNVRVLEPKQNTLLKLTTFVPPANTEQVLEALHEAGAGNVGNYRSCSFRVAGTGTFMPTAGTQPYIGSVGQLEHVGENRVEVIFPKNRKNRVLAALQDSHPYEEVAYYLHQLENENQEVGSGVIGELESPMHAKLFLNELKRSFHVGSLRHTAIAKPTVQKVALCGGAGSFLLPRAIQAGADVFISADFKYHEFFDADGQITIADVGHYESEQFTKDLLAEVLREKLPTFAVNFSKTITNPISYL